MRCSPRLEVARPAEERASHPGLSSAAFAALLGAGSVVTWGDAHCGGDSSAVQDQLKNVQCIQASCGAFAEGVDSKV